MILVRDVFQAKFGRGDELVAMFREMRDQAPADAPTAFREARLLTDVSGSYFTVVLETMFESVGEWEVAFAQLMSMQGSSDGNDAMNELVRSGHREFFRIES
jgi:hypothetical protein